MVDRCYVSVSCGEQKGFCLRNEGREVRSLKICLLVFVGLISFLEMGPEALGEEAQSDQEDASPSYEYSGDLKEESWDSNEDYSSSDGSRVPGKDLSSDVGKDTLKGTQVEETRKDTAEDVSKDVDGDSGKDMEKDSKIDVGEVLARDVSKDTAEDASKDVGGDSGKDMEKDSKKDAGEVLARDVSKDSAVPLEGDRPLRQLEISLGSASDSIHERPDKNDALVIAGEFQPAIHLGWKQFWRASWLSFVEVGMIFKDYKGDDDGIGELTGKKFLERKVLLGLGYKWDEVSFLDVGLGVREVGSPKKKSKGFYLLEKNRNLSLRSRFSRELLLADDDLSLALLGELGYHMKGNKTFKGGWDYGYGLGLKLKSFRSVSFLSF